jgi:hypothetical protein
MQSTPTPRFIDLQLDVPEFTHVSDAENFLAKIALLCSQGHLDIQSAQELSGLVKLWIDTQYQREELNYKISPPEQRDTVIKIQGGLPSLPGTNITMPVLDHASSQPGVNGHALAPPSPVVTDPGTNSAPSAPVNSFSEEPGTNSTNGQGGTSAPPGAPPVHRAQFPCRWQSLARSGAPVGRAAPRPSRVQIG